MLYVSWIGFFLAYVVTNNRILGYAAMALFVAFIVWRLTPNRSAGCEVPATPIDDHSKNATD